MNDVVVLEISPEEDELRLKIGYFKQDDYSKLHVINLGFSQLNSEVKEKINVFTNEMVELLEEQQPLH